MKRSERHKIKKDEFSTFMISFIKAVSPYWRELAVTLVIVLVVLIAGFSYKAYMLSREKKANFLIGKYIASGKEPVLEKFPTPFPQMKALIKAAKLADEKKNDKAIETIRNTPHKGILRNYLYFMEGELLAEKGNCEEAIKVWQKVNNEDEDFPYDALLAHMGRCQFKLGKEKEAISSYNQLISLYPDSPYIREAKYKSGL
ncbi:MAG: tetratricopeptide repeat protein [Candidatus Aminicenantes bacterium]|nr:tetratricopeptide repeat protein [Candidatus Aminicenantes bacterium]